MEKIKQFIKRNISVIDILLTPFVYPAAFLLKIVRLGGVQKLPHCKKALIDVGVFPILNHYYEPQFDNRLIDFSQDRNLPGINWSVSSQLELLERFTFSNELENIPQGDVLFEYLELLPSLNRGVVVHIHDIFSPKNYKKQWLQDNICFWNEQYLLEAFLSHNRDWKIIGALNYLHNKHYEKLKSVAPFLKVDPEPGSFYIQKIN